MSPAQATDKMRDAIQRRLRETRNFTLVQTLHDFIDPIEGWMLQGVHDFADLAEYSPDIESNLWCCRVGTVRRSDDNYYVHSFFWKRQITNDFNGLADIMECLSLVRLRVFFTFLAHWEAARPDQNVDHSPTMGSRCITQSILRADKSRVRGNTPGRK
jgi:hypothetical protein